MNLLIQTVVKQILITCVLCWLLPVYGLKSPPLQQTITLTFHHYAGIKKLTLYDEKYVNKFNEPIIFYRFKYYISHIRIIDRNNKVTTLSDKPHLIDEADSASKILVFNSAIQSIQFLTFQIGVDSILNVSGVQTGDLDPLKGMFWTWNSGYIFAKVEGRSDSSDAPSHYFNWDVGGFKNTANASRQVKLKTPVKDLPANNSVITINADLLQCFNAVHPVKISQYPLCHQPGELAMKIADNYSSMFFITP